MILYPLVALVTVLLLVGAVRYGQPALEHRKHARTLTNIARLEIELGIVAAPPSLQSKWEAGVSAAATRYTATVKKPQRIAYCDHCQCRVVLDGGRCNDADEIGKRCARYRDNPKAERRR